ncbi:hypothetical protein K0M31_019179 [Melipona bicolor]|uniref:Uncharacterized protein n=1 Tax=Melipona bicolor TaxID=60889 RepID=A0AA40G1V5_9HYME|nr:hypothetical protein K0M31_019179 [Melipona bicolor]
MREAASDLSSRNIRAAFVSRKGEASTKDGDKSGRVKRRRQSVKRAVRYKATNLKPTCIWREERERAWKSAYRPISKGETSRETNWSGITWRNGWSPIGELEEF